MKPSVLITGGNGLIGSKLVETFSDDYDFEMLDISDPQKPVDITNQGQIESVFSQSAADAVVHFAAFTDVSAAWAQRGDKEGLAYRVNVLGTENIAKAAARYGKHLIHISTAYVFDGEKESLYSEGDPINPIEWYGQTKADAEEKVMNAGKNWTVLRIDQPFRSDPFPKLDIAHRVAQGVLAGSLPPQFTNHYFGPTYIEDFAKVLDWVLRTKTPGLFHASSGEQWSDFLFSQAIEDLLKRDHILQTKIQPGDLNSYLETAKRPYQRNTALNSQKLQSMLDFAFTPIKTAIKSLQLSVG